MIMNFPVYVNPLIPEVRENNTQYSHFYITGNTIVSNTKTSRLMLFRDTIVCCENHITSTLCGKNVDVCNITVGTTDVCNITVGTTRPYGHRFALKTTLHFVHTTKEQR